MKYGPERAGDVKHSLADISRAEQFLGYKPKVDFEEGLSRTVDWYRSHDPKLQTAEPAAAIPGFEESQPVVIFHVSPKIPASGRCGCGSRRPGVVGDGTFFEANRPQVVSIEIPLSRLPESWDGFRIAQLSDLHYDDHFSAVPIRKARRANQPVAARPDGRDRRLCYRSVSGGRSHMVRAAKMIEPCAQLVAQMRAPLASMPAWATMTWAPTRPISPRSCSPTESQCCGTARFPSNAMARGSGWPDWMTFWKGSPTSSWL